MRKILTTILILICLAGRSQYAGDTLSPMRVVEKYVSTNGFPEKIRHFCCEMYHEWMAPQTLGQQLGPKVIRECVLLYEDTNRAVVTVWLHDSITSMDVYFYLQHRQVWTVYAVRSLTMKDIAAKELLRLDSIPKKQRGKKYTKSSGRSWQFDFENTKLWGQPDTVLAAYFYQNRNEFTELEKQRSRGNYSAFPDSSYTLDEKSKKMIKIMNQVLLREIVFDKNAPGSVLYLLGGVLDNSVGYMYQPDPTKLPAISAGYFILIRPLGNGWYLYKTT